MKIADLKDAEYNPRSITEASLEGLKFAMEEFGDLSGNVHTKKTGNLDCGHQRMKGLREKHGNKLKMKKQRDTERPWVVVTPSGDRYPVRVVDWPIQKEKAANLAANNPHTQGAFTSDAIPMLKALEVDAPELVTNLNLAPLHVDLVDAFSGEVQDDGSTDEDAVPEPPDKAKTKKGDLWILGRHRLFCGDSSSAKDVNRLLEGAKIHLVNTDPPYNVKVEPRSNNAIAAGLSSFVQSDPKLSKEFKRDAARGGEQRPRGKKKKTATHHQGLDLARRPGAKDPTHKKLRAKDRPLENDFLTDAEFDKMLLAWFGNISRVLVAGRGFYIWGGYANLGNYPAPLEKCGLYFSQGVVWDKEHPVLTRKDFMGAFEICFYGWKKGAAHKWFGPTNATDLWHLKKISPNKMIHLTEKPVELAERAIGYSSQIDENVLDLFGGSGSTLIACERMDRNAFLMELDELYCDVIVQRWENYTGKKAKCIKAKKTKGQPRKKGKKKNAPA